MVLKQNWEKADKFFKLDRNIILKAIKDSYPDKELSSYEVIPGGCANLNIKILFKNIKTPVLLRIYLHNRNGALFEQNLYSRIGKDITVPEILSIGKVKGYSYAFVSYIQGITLREAILNYDIGELEGVIYEAGAVLSDFKKYSFDYSGFFNDNLKVESQLDDNFCVDYIERFIRKPNVYCELGSENIKHIREIIDKNLEYFPSNEEACLVHADYDPSNILVDKKNGKWKIIAIIDWEFTFSGSYLCDVANMLRYSHLLPNIYQESFLKGIKESGIILPKNWIISVYLLNLMSLLDLLERAVFKKKPIMHQDVKDLIAYYIDKLNEFK